MIEDRDLDRLCDVLVNAALSWWSKHEPAVENELHSNQVHEFLGFERDAA